MNKSTKQTDKKNLSLSIDEYTVSELAILLQRTIEGYFGNVRIRGEVSGLKIAASGHIYFDLKDENALISAVCWRSTASRLKMIPEDGAEVIVKGKITTYIPRSNYQIIIDSVEFAGEGALLKLLEDRRKKLAKEGLFDAERKRDIPFLPDLIGIITSPTGAVISDILHRLRDRFPRHVMMWPVPVQGEEAAAAIVAAINGFNNFQNTAGVSKPDILIIARGGGSIEDLWAFNDENLVRATVNSEIPIVSAIGHETDTTLLDFAADLRAPTPTAAAELIVPVRSDLVSESKSLSSRLALSATRLIGSLKEQTVGLSRGLRDPQHQLDRGSQSLDFSLERLDRSRKKIFYEYSQKLDSISGKLNKKLLSSGIEFSDHKVKILGNNLFRYLKILLTGYEQKIISNAKMLESVSHKRVLSRGYALLRGKNNLPVISISKIKSGMSLDVELKDGSFQAVAKKD